MGFVKRILVGFFTLLGVVIGSITNVLGLEKSEYFLEIKEEIGSESSAAATSTASSATSGSEATSPTAQRPAAPAPAVSTPGSAAPKPTPDIISSPSSEAQSIQVPAQPRASESAASSVMVASTGSSDEASSDSHVEPFAPNYLLNRSTTGGRRRPGPSLNQFKDMAKDVGK
ncbi:MAG: hypothetical protein AAF289_16490 [Cyanobacteria bacterium P01_A01_bin.135]